MWGYQVWYDRFLGWHRGWNYVGHCSRTTMFRGYSDLGKPRGLHVGEFRLKNRQQSLFLTFNYLDDLLLDRFQPLQR